MTDLNERFDQTRCGVLFVIRLNKRLQTSQARKPGGSRAERFGSFGRLIRDTVATANRESLPA